MDGTLNLLKEVYCVHFQLFFEILGLSGVVDVVKLIEYVLDILTHGQDSRAPRLLVVVLPKYVTAWLVLFDALELALAIRLQHFILLLLRDKRLMSNEPFQHVHLAAQPLVNRGGSFALRLRSRLQSKRG